MKNKYHKGRGAVIIIAALAILAGLAFYAYVILSSTGVGEKMSIKLGLDLAGGVSITYQADEKNPSAENMKDTIYKLQKRVQGYSTEAAVYQEGDNRITVEIPGVTDANKILEELGKPGSLQFETSDGKAFMTGTQVKDAQAATITNNMGNKEYVVELTLTDDGAKIFGEITSANIGKNLPIVYDDTTISNPTVQTAITGGKAQISGMATYEEAETLASNIRIGSLSLKLSELRSQVVGPQLGSEAMETSMKAAAIGLTLIVIFMLVYYFVPGLAASLALMIYTGLMIAVLYLFDITLTLPGVAGIILSIGMAVDANVITFARIREEISAGKSVTAAIEVGFKKARTAILDGNMTTLIAAAVLGVRGTGTVKGFAITLALGIFLSLFTALFVSRHILEGLYAVGLRDVKLYGKAVKWKPLKFIEMRYVFFGLSIFITIAGFAAMGVNKAEGKTALNYSLDFVGGTSTTVPFDKSYSMSEVDSQIVPLVEDITGDSDVQTTKVQDSNSVIFKTRSLTLAEREKINTMFEEKFKVKEKDIQSETISSTISGEMRSDAVQAVIIAMGLILLYVWFRFADPRYAVGAIIALIHDILIVLTCYAVLRISVGGTFVACMLTIVGYSINDTIVIFDRIRENLKANHEKETPELLCTVADRSLTETLSRSINTVLTVLVMVFLLWLFGVAAIKDFALPLMVGLISGAYSSVCIATELWFVFRLRVGKKRLIKGKKVTTK